ncbi:MAG: cytochrome C, partial [Anaerolineae bacterium]|nr:cytochrome C [Anaerolineae bacterium]
MGYKVEKGTARLILAFFALGFLLFGLGAVAALGVVLTRAPSITLLNPYWFYTALTFHGVLMLT